LCQHPKIFPLASLANILDPPLFITYLSPCERPINSQMQQIGKLM
jgi:hypothetical protein